MKVFKGGKMKKQKKVFKKEVNNFVWLVFIASMVLIGAYIMIYDYGFKRGVLINVDKYFLGSVITNLISIVLLVKYGRE